MGTINKIVELLEKEPLTAREICLKLGMDIKKENEIYIYIEKIKKIVKKNGKNLYFIPPKCLDCGYIFNDYKVSKCPRCKSERISEARFFIK